LRARWTDPQPTERHRPLHDASPSFGEAAGRGHRLKGSTIAIEVFGKPVDFNAVVDAVVRVQARRVRQRRAYYYVNHGSSSRLRIELPVGGYVPTFRCAQSPTRTFGAGSSWRFTAVVLFCVAALTAFGWVACGLG